MEKKKRWLINILSIGCLIVYILFKKCLIVVLSYLSAILLKPFIDLILEKLHIKNKVFSIIMTIIIFILLYTCFFLFVFFSCLFFIKTLFLRNFINKFKLSFKIFFQQVFIMYYRLRWIWFILLLVCLFISF